MTPSRQPQKDDRESARGPLHPEADSPMPAETPARLTDAAGRRKATRFASPPSATEGYSSGVPLLLLGMLAIVLGGLWRHPGVLALGLALTAVPATIWGLTVHGLRGVRLHRNAPDRAFEGEEVEVHLRLENGSRVPLFLPKVVATFVPELHERKEILFPMRVDAGESVEGMYRGRCLLPRGRYALGPCSVTVADPFGWFRARKTVHLRQSLKVYPRFDAFGLIERSGEAAAFVEATLARGRIGESNEFFSVREYRRGDPLRHVHWPISAHRGTPVVREHARPACGDLWMYLDLYRRALVGIGRSSSLEHGVKIVAALSAHALHRGHRVQISARGEPDRVLPLAGGRQQLAALLDLLADVKPNGDTPLDEILADTLHSIAPGSTVVLTVSPYLRSSRRFDRCLRSLALARTRVILAVFDDETFRSIYGSATDNEPVEAYVHRQRARGIEARVVPCAAHLPTVFTGPLSLTAPAPEELVS